MIVASVHKNKGKASLIVKALILIECFNLVPLQSCDYSSNVTYSSFIEFQKLPLELLLGYHF